jgi:type II secretory pathway pseudopilin PulG
VPLSRTSGLARAGYGIVETSIVVAVVAVLIFVVVTHYSRSLSESRDTALRSELATLRNTINLFSAVKGRCPESLGELITLEYALPFKAGPTELEKTEDGGLEVKEKILFNPKYLEAYALDDEGNILDPFGLPYVFDPVQCTVHAQSPGHETL